MNGRSAGSQWHRTHPTSLHPGRLPKDISLVSPTQVPDVLCDPPPPWLSHDVVTRVLFPKSLSSLWSPRASTPVDTSACSSLSHDESDTAFCLLDQNLRSPPLWISIPPLIERLSSRCAAQSLSVYAMMWSDRTPQRQCVQVVGRPSRNQPTLLGLAISAW